MANANLTSASRKKFIAYVVSVAFVLGIVAVASPRFLTGSLLSPTDIAFLLKERADKDGDFILTAREIRKELVRIIRDVILQKTEGDINGDGVTNKADISATVTGFRALLLATCGNFVVEAGEQCDDNTNTCSNVCRTIVHTGNLFVTLAEITSPQQLLGGTLGESVLSLKLHAEGEPIDVTSLQFSIDGQVGSIDGLELYRVGETQKFADATIGGCGSDFVPSPGQTLCAKMQSQQLVVPEGSSVDILVRPRIKKDSEAGVSGDQFRVFVNNSISPEGHGAVRARGLLSSNELPLNNGNDTADGEIFIGTDGVSPFIKSIFGEFATVVMSKITSIANVNSAEDDTPILVDEFAAGRFQIAAAAHQNTKNGLNVVSPKDMIIDVHAPNVQLDPNGFFISNDNEDIRYTCTPRKNTLQLITTPEEATGDFHLECTSTDVPLSIQVEQNSTNVFRVIVKVINAQVNPEQASELQVFLQNVSDYANQQTDNFSYGGSHFRWIDMDAGASTFIWVDGVPEFVNGPLYHLAPINL